MALKPTIYKFRIVLSDTNRDYYDTQQLTLALHPSETMERMMARVMAFCLKAQPDLVFTKGLSTIEEPDLWVKTLDDQINLWVEIGEPSVDRLKKASRLAKQVDVFTFNSKSDIWWQQSINKVRDFGLNVFQFNFDELEALANSAQRTMDLSVMITGNSLYVDSSEGSFVINWNVLQNNE